MADHADADCDACEKRAVERVEHSVEQTMLDTVRDYDTVNERNRRITTERGSATPALLPVWLMTTVKEGKTYTFAVNGQTGKLMCDVPADKKKSLLWGGGVFAGILGVAALILALMDALGSGSLLICAGGCGHHRTGGRRCAEGAAEAGGAAERGRRLYPGGVLPPGCERRPFSL